MAEFELMLSSSLKSISVADSEPLNIGILFAADVNPAKAVNSASKDCLVSAYALILCCVANDVAEFELMLSSSNIDTAAGAVEPPDTFPITFISAKLAIFAKVTPPSFILTFPEPFVADNSIVESSTVTSISSAFAVIPSPPITFNVTVPDVPPPVNPDPAVTPSISPDPPPPPPYSAKVKLVVPNVILLFVVN